MMHLLSPPNHQPLSPAEGGEGLVVRGVGLRYNEETKDRGAQTGRRGLAGPVRTLLGGRASPAVLFPAHFGSGFVFVLLPIFNSAAASARKRCNSSLFGACLSIH